MRKGPFLIEAKESLARISRWANGDVVIPVPYIPIPHSFKRKRRLMKARATARDRLSLMQQREARYQESLAVNPEFKDWFASLKKRERRALSVEPLGDFYVGQARASYDIRIRQSRWARAKRNATNRYAQLTSFRSNQDHVLSQLRSGAFTNENSELAVGQTWHSKRDNRTVQIVSLGEKVHAVSSAGRGTTMSYDGLKKNYLPEAQTLSVPQVWRN